MAAQERKSASEKEEKRLLPESKRVVTQVSTYACCLYACLSA